MAYAAPAALGWPASSAEFPTLTRRSNCTTPVVHEGAVDGWRPSSERPDWRLKRVAKVGYAICLIVSPPIGSPNAATAVQTTMRNRLRFAGEPRRQSARLRAGDPAGAERASELVREIIYRACQGIHSFAAPAVGLANTGAILALIDPSIAATNDTLLASRPTTMPTAASYDRCRARRGFSTSG
jgi:hypothetical protein